MKKVLILGTGAQGTTVAKRLDQHPAVGEIICADYDMKAVNELVGMLTKARGVQVDANNVADIVKLAEGVDLLVNALPYRFAKNVLDAAVEAKTNYQDFAAGQLVDPEIDDSQEIWIHDIGVMYDEYGKKFAANGKLAIIGTGSAPGLILVAARKAVRELDSCDTIYMFVYEGCEAERFQPFWWSPEVALEDMFNAPIATINGEIVNTEPYSLPIERKFEYMDYPVRLVEHAHEEPFFMGLNKDTFFKGAKNIHFKYGGVGVEFSEPLFKEGKLSMEPDENGVVPRLEVLKTLPRPPKEPAVLQEILDEGLVRDDGAFGCEIIGERDGRKIKVETHVFAPGLAESFEKLQMSAEQYITGLSGFMFTRMLVRDEIKQTGLISTDMLSEEENRIYMAYENAIGIYAETTEEYLD